MDSGGTRGSYCFVLRMNDVLRSFGQITFYPYVYSGCIDRVIWELSGGDVGNVDWQSLSFAVVTLGSRR